MTIIPPPKLLDVAYTLKRYTKHWTCDNSNQTHCDSPNSSFLPARKGLRYARPNRYGRCSFYERSILGPSACISDDKVFTLLMNYLLVVHPGKGEGGADDKVFTLLMDYLLD